MLRLIPRRALLALAAALVAAGAQARADELRPSGKSLAEGGQRPAAS